MGNLEEKDNANESCNLGEKDIEFFKSASRSVIDLIQCIAKANLLFSNKKLDDLKKNFETVLSEIKIQDFNNIQTSENQKSIKQLNNLITSISDFILELSNFVENYNKNDIRETDSYIPKLFYLVHEIKTTGNIIINYLSQINLEFNSLKQFESNLIKLWVAEQDSNSSTGNLKIQRLNHLDESENLKEISIPPYFYLEIRHLSQLVKNNLMKIIG